jgi:hypothetical protein
MNIREAIEAVQQPRSRFQLENFVVGQHDTIEMQFYQLVIELQSSLSAYEMAELSVRKIELKMKRLLETGDELDALDAEELALGLGQQKVVMLGAARELEIMMEMFHSMPHFTRDEIDRAQPEYWQKRLTRQTDLQIMSGNVQWAQLDSMRQAGFLEKAIEEQEAKMALTNGHTEVTP